MLLDPLPCWRHLPANEVKRRVKAVVREIEVEAATERHETGKTSLGAESVMATDPHHRPEKLDKSPAPLFHAAKKEVRRAMWEAYAWVVAEFHIAAGRLRAGDWRAQFPEGTFPPNLPFVPFARGHPP